jgi:hypothetical protein
VLKGAAFSRPSLFMLVINAKGETTTALAALKLGRRFLGIDRNEEFVRDCGSVELAVAGVATEPPRIDSPCPLTRESTYMIQTREGKPVPGKQR